MHWNGHDMDMMRKLGWVSLLAAAVAMGGCGDDDGDNNSDSSAGTSATMNETDAVSTDTEDPTGDTESESESEDGSSGGEVDCSEAPSYATDIEPLWETHACVAMCHEPGGSWASTDLTMGAGYEMLVEADGLQTTALADVQLVIPGDTEHSYLLNKLEGTQGEVVSGAAGGTQMPQGQPPMSADEIATVEQWIACGAEP